MKIIYSLIFCLVFTQLNAQPKLTMLKDINPSSVLSPPSSLTIMGNKMYFATTDSVNGTELWVTDGTAAGTKMVKNINPKGGSFPLYLTVFNGKLYFRATDSLTNYELFVSDGTANGTYQLKDIRPGVVGSQPNNFIVFGNQLIFSASDGTNGQEPWVTNGTPAGTKLLKNINPSTASGVSNPEYTIYKNMLYFTANDGMNGAEMWVSDGTTTGTQLFKNLNTDGGGFGSPHNYKVLNNLLLFAAQDTVNNAELWVSDGTPAGTKLLKEINTSFASEPTLFYEFNGKLYFLATIPVNGQLLWSTDGTPSGILPFPNATPPSAGNMGTYKGKMYFGHRYAASSKTELWETDGTTQGTKLLKDLWVGPAPASGIGPFSVYGDFMYFAASDGSNGMELWYTDGTANGTKKFTPAGSTTVNPLQYFGGIFMFNDTAYMVANFDSRGIELWKLQYEEPVGLNRLNKIPGMSIYPNPAGDFLSIELKSVSSLRIIDSKGALVFSSAILDAEILEIDMSLWSSGVYMIIDDKGNCMKFVKG